MPWTFIHLLKDATPGIGKLYGYDRNVINELYVAT